MEYERIEKVQTGIISPSKLRMKLLGPHHHRKKDGSNSNSSRTSPSRLEESDFARNSLLDSKSDFDETVVAPSLDLAIVIAPGDAPVDPCQGNKPSCQPKGMLLTENGDMGRVKMLHFPKNNDNGNLSAVHPMRTLEDENPDYDSNASSSSFEFHKGERSVQNPITRQFSRPIPSKWNDAEKWIMNRQNAQHNYSKKNALYNQTNRLPMTNMVRVAPESASYDQKSTMSGVVDTKRVDFCQPVQMAFDRFSFVSTTTNPFHGEAYGGSALIDQSTQSKDLREVDQRELNVAEDMAEGLVEEGHEDKVYLLKKALYGLKQASRAWCSGIDDYLLSLGFMKCLSEITLYVKQKGNDVLIVSLYVDDLLVTGNNTKLSGEFKKEMMLIFEMTDLGVLTCFLGMEIKQSEGEVFICQKKYAKEILKKFSMEECKATTT